MSEQRVWKDESGKENTVAISTRVRLARNLPDLPFPRLLSVQQRYEAAKRILDAFKQVMPEEYADYDVIDMGKISKNEALSLVEQRLVSPEFAAAGAGGCLLLSHDHSISIMLNEEDHLRIQVIAPGLVPEQAYEVADAIESRLDSALHFAFDERLGYLTECPTNLGTGLRASVMLHLPLLRAEGGIGRMAESVSRVGLTVRGAYGEDTAAKGAFYQISNQITLGISEKSAIGNLKNIVRQIVRAESAAQEKIGSDPALCDRLWRSLGTLRSARMLSGDEALELASDLRLGIAGGVFKGEKIDPDTANSIVMLAGPATLTVKAGRELSAAERDALRAELVRDLMR